MRIAVDIARGMRYLQNISPPIIHRDLRSPNILIASLDENAKVLAKVADFGLALSVAPLATGFLGTWQWHAPEVLDANSVFYDETADIYSFAVVLWEIFTRDYPFEEYRTQEAFGKKVGVQDDGEDVWVFRVQNIKSAIIYEDLRPSFPAEAKVPKEVQNLIRSCWQRDKLERPKFNEITKTMEEILGKYFPDSLKISNEGRISIASTEIKKKALFSVASASSSDMMDKIGNMSPIQQPKFHHIDDVSSSSNCFDLPEKPISIHVFLSKIWVGCENGSLMVYSAKDCSHIKTHKHHSTKIYSITSVNRQIWTSSEIGSLYVYSGSKGSFTKELPQAHGSHLIRYLCGMYMEAYPCIWSCAPTQNQITVWNAENYQTLYTFKTDIFINCFYIHLKTIWIGSHKDVYLYTIDYKTKALRLVEKLEGHTGRVNEIIHPADDEVWSCSDDGVIYVWSLAKKSQICKMDVNSGSIRAMDIVNNTVWSGGANNNIVCWSINSKAAKHEFVLSDEVMCIGKVGTSVWTGTADKKLRIIPNEYQQ